LSDFMRAALADQAITVHGHMLTEGKTRILLQDDKLHPSPPGCAVLALIILDRAQSMQPVHSADDVRWNPKEVFRLGFKAAAGPAKKPAKQGAHAVPAGKQDMP